MGFGNFYQVLLGNTAQYITPALSGGESSYTIKYTIKKKLYAQKRYQKALHLHENAKTTQTLTRACALHKI